MANYRFKEFVQEVMNKLSIIHTVDDLVIGKNKICFKMNGTVVTVRKNRDTETRQQKTIISCSEMFPFVIHNSFEGTPKYNNVDVLNTVNTLDSYFVSELGYEPERSAICARYDNLKYLLLPFYIIDYKEHAAISQVWEEILELLASDFNDEKSRPNGFTGNVITFVGKNMDTDQEKAFILLSDPYKLQIFAVDCKDDKLIGYNDPDDKIDQLEVKYGIFSETEMISQVKRFIKKYYGFKYYDLVFDSNDMIETNDENEEEEP